MVNPTENQLEQVRRMKAARDLKKDIQKLEKLMNEMDNAVSAKHGRVDVMNLCKHLKVLDELQSQIRNNVIKFL